MRSAVSWAIAGWLLLGATYVVAMATPVVSLPSDDRGFRRITTPTIGPRTSVGQTFFMTAGGLHAIDVNPARTGTPGTQVRLTLSDITTPSEQVVRTSDVNAGGFTQDAPFRFEFPAIQDSRNRHFRLEVTSSADASGIAFWATEGERYPNGAMEINRTARWADLTFATYASVPSRWQTLMNFGSGGSSRGALVLALFAANWVVAGALLVTLARRSGEPRQAD